MRKSIVLFTLLSSIFSNYALSAQQPNSEKIEELLEMSIEELMNIEITVASKTTTKVFDTPAAVYVLTSEDIRRSGATNIPDALRAIPGVEVVRINSHTYSVSIRGFTEDYANKLLVMIDGRTIYTPIFAGVWWNMHDLVLEDVERIEVVRGPGGTLWGANAVNGVINIVTKKVSDTQGTLITTGGGTEELLVGSYRYGGKLRENAYYRVYSKYSNHDDGPNFDGTEGADEWDIFNTGMRIDWDKTEMDKFSFHGNIFSAQFGESYPKFSLTAPYSENVTRKADLIGGHVLGRWNHTLSDDSDMILQLFYDRSERNEVHYEYGEERDTFDVDFQHNFRLDDIQNIVWGLGYRFSTDSFKRSDFFTMIPQRRNLHLYSGFIQDQIDIIMNILKLTLGIKLENNDYTDLELQPSIRIAWTPNHYHTLWAAASRAIRTPSRYERDSRTQWAVYPGVIPTNIIAFGSDDADSEELNSFELGYRVKPSAKLILDWTAYANKYRNLRSVEMGTPQFQATPVPHMLIKSTFSNGFSAEAYGTEVSAKWNVTDIWKFIGSYSLLHIFAHPDQSSTDISNEALYEGAINNQLYLRSSFDLSDDKELDLSVKYADNLSSMGIGNYVRFDARFAWYINKNTELNLVAQNLLDSKHPEYSSWIYQNTEAERSFFANLILRY